MLQDIRFALRLLGKNLGFTVVAITTLGLAVAANAVVFSIVHAILIRPLPFPEPERLVRINTQFVEQPSDTYWPFSAHEYTELAAEVHAFQSMGAYDDEDANLTGSDQPVAVHVATVTASFLPTLGVPPMLGRFFDENEDRPGDVRAIVLGYDLFKTVFGGDPSVVGRTVQYNATPVTVVGVMPRGFEFPERTQLWAPLRIDLSKSTRGSHWLNVIGRLKPGLGLEAARDELRPLMSMWATRHDKEDSIDPIKHAIAYQFLQEELVRPVRAALLTLQAAVIFVLLIACANISNLLLARAEARSGEIAVRAALGATQGRMARQFLTESLVLGTLGAGLGIVLAMWGLDAVMMLLPEGVPRAGEIQLDTAVLAFAVLVALGASFVFGLAPIVHTHGGLAGTLRAAGQRTTSAANKQLFRRLLILAQVTLAIMLVTGAGLTIRSFVRLQKTKLGFDPHGLVSVEVQLPPKSYPNDAAMLAFWKRFRDGASILPGVKAASLMSGLPPKRRLNWNSVHIVGLPASDPYRWHVDYWQIASEGYFETLGIPLLRGRLFDSTDDESKPGVVVINETMARSFFPTEDAIGKRLQLYNTAPVGESPVEQTIVGVVADSKQGGLEAPVGSEVYIPVQQITQIHNAAPNGESFLPRAMNLMVRVDGDPRSMFATLRAHVASLDENLAVVRMQTMDSTVYDAIAKPRFVTTLLGCFAAVALLMAAIGIYGVMSYAVEQRTKELSIRMALGADAARLQKMLVLEGLRLALVGMVVGLVLAGAGMFVFSRWAVKELFDVQGLDPMTYLLVILVTGGVSALACYIPARRATLIHPMTAMRGE
ncbi:ABC transporter permease [Pendulispora rubella]|uniref:ABC transporter permease n=1 Tax=Pendulispora rubella TaxID=2741070 RepID=A0ABZ2KZL9_9BACT